MDDKVAPILFILATPDKLRVEVAVAALVRHAHRIRSFFCRTDWYSAVGMFLRVASSCLRVSTVLIRIARSFLAIRRPPEADRIHKP
jgi:hypothetical protein